MIALVGVLSGGGQGGQELGRTGGQERVGSGRTRDGKLKARFLILLINLKEQHNEGWELGGKGAQKCVRRENMAQEAGDSDPPVLSPPPPFLRHLFKKPHYHYGWNWPFSQPYQCYNQRN